MHPNMTRRQTKTYKTHIYTGGALYIAHDLQMRMRNAIVSEAFMKQGPREAAVVVYALVPPAFM